MTRWRIEMRDARGEREIGTIVVQAPNLAKARQHAARVYRRHLSGSQDVYLGPRGHRTYAVIHGEDDLGQVRITCLEPLRPAVSDALRSLEQERLKARGEVGRSSSCPRRGAEPVRHPYPLFAERR